MAVKVFAVHCHPDDIEFTMAGTLFQLREAGCELHYMTVANGSCGTDEFGLEEIIRIRTGEAKAAAEYLGAEYHPSIVNDLEVFYTQELIRKVASVIRSVGPDILLLPSPEDYMEDHMNTCRVGVTAAFVRGMPNYHTIPPVAAIAKDVVLYHALPHGLTDMMRNSISPDFYVDISPFIGEKEKMLACHESQKNWLDRSQGMDSYLYTMRDFSAEVGGMSKKFPFAEGWRGHSHFGYAAIDADPLKEILPKTSVCPA